MSNLNGLSSCVTDYISLCVDSTVHSYVCGVCINMSIYGSGNVAKHCLRLLGGAVVTPNFVCLFSLREQIKGYFILLL